MSFQQVRPVLILLALGLLAGCTGGFYETRQIQPEGGSSQVCLDRCTRLREECEARQTVREQECAERRASAKADYDLCVGSGSGPCSPPGSCLGADMSICQRQHEECFIACGGRLERHLRPRPWELRSQTQPSAAPAGSSAG